MKDLYIEEWERVVGDYVEAGMTEAEAERKAYCEAYNALIGRVANLADRARDAAKYAEFE